MGRRVPLREDWLKIRVKVMYKVVTLKFEQNEILRQKLLDTEDRVLIEGNSWHDNFWGTCNCPRCKSIKGTNMLGEILMKVREFYVES